jgi:GNAT superfamily N-acetyltransferase
MARLRIEPLRAEHLDDAAVLLSERHRRQRRSVPELSPEYEEPGAARAAIDDLLARPGASPFAASESGLLVGYLIGTPRDRSRGPNMFVEGAGHAVIEPETVRDLYGAAAARWVDSGATIHSVIVPSDDPNLIDAWFRVEFGMQFTHGIRPPATTEDDRGPPEGIRIRRAERSDIPTLARLELALPEHQSRSPVFSPGRVPEIGEVMGELETDFDDPAFTTFVAEHEGSVIGSSVGCSIDKSSEHRGIVKAPGAGFLGFAAVLPEARGLGAGRALGEAVLVWARDAGYPTVVTDWRETNLLSSRTWPRLGFRPMFRRLNRTIA